MKIETIGVITEPLKNNGNYSYSNHQTRPVIRETPSYVSHELVENLVDREDDLDYFDDSTNDDMPKKKRGRPKKNINIICSKCRTGKTPERNGLLLEDLIEIIYPLCNACGSRCSKQMNEKEDPSPKKPTKPRVKKTPKPKQQIEPGQKKLGRPIKPKPQSCPYIIKGKLCGASETPEWRKCKFSDGVEYTVCNRCGIHNTKKLKRELESKIKNSIYNLID